MRLFAATLLAALALAAPAAAAVPGVNVSYVNDFGDPYVVDPGNSGDYAHDAGDTARAWRDIADSGARTIRTFVAWNLPTGTAKWRRFAAKARAHGLNVLLTVTGDRTSMASPSAYAAKVAELAAALRGNVAAYEVWNEEDGPDFWAGGPQPGAYAALLRAAYPAIKRADPGAKVLVGGLVANDVDFLNALYDNGARGSFDGVGVHTDTACLTTAPTEYYREPSGRIGRFSFTGYREIRRSMLAHGDDKPVWMTELGWSTTNGQCARGGRAGTKPGGVSEAQQARFLTQAYGCMANDPYLVQAAWFNLHDLDSTSLSDERRLGLVTDGFARKPAFAAFRHAGGARAIPCGGTIDGAGPSVRFAKPTDGARFSADLPVSIVASDDHGVSKIEFYADGRRIPYGWKPAGRGATLKLRWQGAKKLSYGPHTLTAKAYDEGKNVGTASVTVTKVGGRVRTRIRMKVAKVRHRRLKLSGRVIPAERLSRVGGYVRISLLHKRGKRWVESAHFAKKAGRRFRIGYRFPQRGAWKVAARFAPRKGQPYRASRAKRVLKVR